MVTGSNVSYNDRRRKRRGGGVRRGRGLNQTSFETL
jgi:hypothetical protein